MGLVSFSRSADEEPVPGYDVGDGILPFSSVGREGPAADYLDCLEEVDRELRDAIQRGDSTPLPRSEVRLHVPVESSKVVRLEGCYEHDLTDSDFDPHVEAAGLNELEWPSLWVAPTSCALSPEGVVQLPPWSEDVRPGVTLALVVGSRAKALTGAEALDAIAGVTTAMDLAIHDEIPGLEGYKMFDTALPLGPDVVPLEDFSLSDAELSLECNGEVLDERTTDSWRFSPEEMIAYVSEVMTLDPGDVVLTGDPTRIDSSVSAGDELTARVDELPPLTATVGRGDP